MKRCFFEPAFSKTFVENDVENISKEKNSDDKKDKGINSVVWCRYGNCCTVSEAREKIL